MEIVIILSLIGFIVGLAMLWGITFHELNRLKSRCNHLEAWCQLLDTKHNRLDELLTDQHEVIGTLVQLSNETTKWIQEVSPVVRRKLL